MKNKLTVREKMRLPRPFSGDGDWKYGPQSPPPNFDRPPQSTETEGVKTSSIITRHIRISPSPKLRSGRPWFAGAGLPACEPALSGVCRRQLRRACRRHVPQRRGRKPQLSLRFAKRKPFRFIPPIQKPQGNLRFCSRPSIVAFFITPVEFPITALNCLIPRSFMAILDRCPL